MKMKETIDIEFTQQAAAPEMMKMLLTLADLVFKMKKILFWLTWLKITKASWWGKFKKKLLDDYGIVPNEKKI